MKGQHLRGKDSPFLKNISKFQTKLLMFFIKKGKGNRG